MAKNAGSLNLKDLLNLLRFGTESANYVIKGNVYNILSNELNYNGVPQIPTLERFCSMFPSYRNYLLRNYDIEFKSLLGKTVVPDSVKISQMALFDGLLFVYDSAKDAYSLVSASYKLFPAEEDIEARKKAIVLKNKKGTLRSYRVDLEYSDDGETVEYKLVNARDFDIDDYKSDDDDNKRFFLVPIDIVMMYTRVIERLINSDNNIVLVKQLYSDGEKVRCVTENDALLKEYSDGILTREEPLKVESNYVSCCLRAPVLGAPSISLGTTKIDILRVTNISLIDKSELSKHGIEKAVNPYIDMYIERYLTESIAVLSTKEDKKDLVVFLKSLPNNQMLMSEDMSKISNVSVYNYVRSLSTADKKKLILDLDLVKECKKYVNYYNNLKPKTLSSEDIDDIGSILKSNPVRVVIKKSDGSLSAFMCTNSHKVLIETYGEDFMKKFESFGVKYFYLVNCVNYEYSPNSMNSKIANNDVYSHADYEVLDSEVIALLKKYGFNQSEVEVQCLKEYIQKVISDTGSSKDDDFLKTMLALKEGVDLSKSRNTVRSESTILVRGLSAYVDGNGKVHEYYKNLDTNKIVSAIVFG